MVCLLIRSSCMKNTGKCIQLTFKTVLRNRRVLFYLLYSRTRGLCNVMSDLGVLRISLKCWFLQRYPFNNFLQYEFMSMSRKSILQTYRKMYWFCSSPNQPLLAFSTTSNMIVLPLIFASFHKIFIKYSKATYTT